MIFKRDYLFEYYKEPVLGNINCLFVIVEYWYMKYFILKL